MLGRVGADPDGPTLYRAEQGGPHRGRPPLGRLRAQPLAQGLGLDAIECREQKIAWLFRGRVLDCPAQREPEHLHRVAVGLGEVEQPAPSITQELGRAPAIERGDQQGPRALLMGSRDLELGEVEVGA